VLISLFTAGLVRGELKEMWEFSEAITGEQIDVEEKEDIKEKKAEKKTNDKGKTWFQFVKEDIVGDGDESESKESDDGDKDSSTEDKDDKSSRKQDDEDEDLFFAFSVRRHRPNNKNKKKQRDEAKDAKSAPEALEKPPSRDKATTPSDSSLEDTVLVEKEGGA
jgi:hypothetical protein